MTDTHKTAIAVVERPGVPDHIHPLVRMAMSQDVDPAKLEKLLAVQLTWEKDEARKGYALAIVNLKASMPDVVARSAAGHFGKYAKLGDMVAAVTPALTNNGLSVSWRPSVSDDTVTMTCRITHSGGHSEEISIPGPIDKSAGKTPLQGLGATITYLERYTLQSILGFATADMDDADESRPDPSKIDAARNLKAAHALTKAGKNVIEVEKQLGRTVRDWTAADLEEIKAMTAPIAKPEKVEPEEATHTEISPLRSVLAGIELASSVAELASVKPRGAQLADQEDREKYAAAYKAKLAKLKAPAREPGE